MIGYDISWAGFNIIEVMSSNKFTFKRIGYLAASQSFHQETEVCFQLIFFPPCTFFTPSIAGLDVDDQYDQERSEQSKSVRRRRHSIRTGLFHQSGSGQRLGQRFNDFGIHFFNLETNGINLILISFYSYLPLNRISGKKLSCSCTKYSFRFPMRWGRPFLVWKRN